MEEEEKDDDEEDWEEDSTDEGLNCSVCRLLIINWIRCLREIRHRRASFDAADSRSLSMCNFN